MHIELDRVDINWAWSDQDLWSFRALWNDGASVDTIASKLKRPSLDVALHVVDQAEVGEIKQRLDGMYGY